LETGETFVNGDVIFHEDIFPFVEHKNREDNVPLGTIEQQMHGVIDEDWPGIENQAPRISARLT